MAWDRISEKSLPEAMMTQASTDLIQHIKIENKSIKMKNLSYQSPNNYLKPSLKKIDNKDIIQELSCYPVQLIIF